MTEDATNASNSQEGAPSNPTATNETEPSDLSKALSLVESLNVTIEALRQKTAQDADDMKPEITTDDGNTTEATVLDNGYIEGIVHGSPRLLELHLNGAVGVTNGSGKDFISGPYVNGFLRGANNKKGHKGEFKAANHTRQGWTACLPSAKKNGEGYGRREPNWTPKGDEYGNTSEGYAKQPALAMLFNSIVGKGCTQRFDLSEFFANHAPFVFEHVGERTTKQGKVVKLWERMPNDASGFWTGTFGTYQMTPKDWDDLYAIAYPVGFIVKGGPKDGLVRCGRIPTAVPADVVASSEVCIRIAEGLRLPAPTTDSGRSGSKKARVVPKHFLMIRRVIPPDGTD